MTAFTLVDMHDLADPIDAALGILGLAVPDAPVQPLDLRDDHGLRLHPTPDRRSTIRLLPASRAAAAWRCGTNRAIGGVVTPASARIDRRPGQPSVNAVTSVSAVRPTASRLRRISTAMSVSALATAPNTCRPPSAVSTLPTRTSRCRSPSSRLRMKVESTVTVIAAAAASAACPRRSREAARRSAACGRAMSRGSCRRQRAEGAPARQRRHDRASERRDELAAGPAPGVDRQCDGQPTPRLGVTAGGACETAAAAPSPRRTASRADGSRQSLT